MEKVAIRVHGYLDKDSNIYVLDDIIQNPLKMEGLLDLHLEPNENKRSKEASLSINYSQVVLKLRQETVGTNQKWKLCYATVNLARCLFGQNARLILSNEELQAALTIANNIINKCLEPEGCDMVIPGIHHHCTSYFNYLEIAYQVHDPQSQIIPSLKNARLLHYNSDNLIFEDSKTSGRSETVYLGNKDHPIVVCYRKDIEIRQRKRNKQGSNGRWRISEGDTECVRMEVRLHKRKMINVLMDDSSAYESGTRLKTFTIEDVFNAYESILHDIRGVFPIDDTPYKEPEKFKQRTAEFIDQWQKLPSDQPLHDFLQSVQDKYSYSDAALNILRANMEAYISSHNTISLDQLLPGTDNSEAMHIDPSIINSDGLVTYNFRKPQEPLEIDSKIAEAYSSLSTLNLKGIIHQAKMPWMPGY